MYNFRFLTVINRDKKVWMDRSSSDNSNDAAPLVDGTIFIKANRLFVTNHQNRSSVASGAKINSVNTDSQVFKQPIAADKVNGNISFQSPEKLLKFESEDDFDKVGIIGGKKVNADQSSHAGTSNGNNDLLGFDLDIKDNVTVSKSAPSSNIDLFGLETLQPTPVLHPIVNKTMTNNPASFTRSNNSFDAFNNLGNFK